LPASKASLALGTALSGRAKRQLAILSLAVGPSAKADPQFNIIAAIRAMPRKN
jgi:hypothetical protein